MIQICHGQNCRDVGAKVLTKKLQALGEEVEIMDCQSLCSYAPTAKKDHISILHANIDKLLKHPKT